MWNAVPARGRTAGPASLAPERVGVGKAIERCLADTGAVKSCWRCRGHVLVAGEEGAEHRARERALHLWKAGARAFEGLTEGQVLAAFASTLAGLPRACPNGR